MSNAVERFFKRIGNRIKFSLKKAVDPKSKDQYELVVEVLNYKGAQIIGDMLGGKILVYMPMKKKADDPNSENKDISIRLTASSVEVSNHIFPTLGKVDEVVAERIFQKAKEKLAEIYKKKEEEVLKNQQKLIDNTLERIKEVIKDHREDDTENTE